MALSTIQYTSTKHPLNSPYVSTKSGADLLKCLKIFKFALKLRQTAKGRRED